MGLIVFTEKEAFKNHKAKFLIFKNLSCKVKKNTVISYSPVIFFKIFGSRDMLLTLIVKKETGPHMDEKLQIFNEI